MTQIEISGDYRKLAAELPLASDDVVFIASDIKQMALDARAAGGRLDANEFIESFQKVLDLGTLLIPAYTDHLQNGDTFDHVNGKPTTGALSNKVFRRKDFQRTKDPLHSVFVWGNAAEEIIALDGDSSLGTGSVFDWLYHNQGKMLCIDVHFQNSLTFVHYVEELRSVKYRKPYHWKIKRLFENGEDVKSFVFYSRKPWILTDLALLQSSAIQAGIATQFVLGNSKMLFFDLVEMHDHIAGMLDRGEKLHRISLVHFAKTIVKKIIGRK